MNNLELLVCDGRDIILLIVLVSYSTILISQIQKHLFTFYYITR